MVKHHYKSISVATIVSVFFASQILSTNTKNVKVNFEPEVIGEVSPEYLSVAIDLAIIVEGAWWQDEDVLQLNHPDLMAAAKLLSPAWIRIGGTEADNVYYQSNNNISSDYRPFGYGSTIRPEAFYQLQQLLDYSNNQLMYTLNAGPGPRRDGEWKEYQLANLIMDFPFLFAAPSLFELGNEIGSFWFSHGFEEQISWETYGQNYEDAKDYLQQLNPNYLLAGPANAFWPYLGEPGSTLFGSSFEFLEQHKPDIFTWHYYPSQSKRCPIRTLTNTVSALLDPGLYTETHRQAAWVQEQINTLSPQSKLWLGESGPAQCGGQPQISDRFVNSLWWLSHLGIMAQYGNEVVIRQSLIGSDYGLLQHDDFSPNPDFYASVLWKKLMGEKVLKVSSNDQRLMAFAHCEKRSDQIMLLAVNINDEPVNLSLNNLTMNELISGTGLNLTSRITFLNRQIAETLNKLPLIMPWQTLEAEILTLPPHSYNFIRSQVTGSTNPCSH